ncbi:hypothetical protein [Burkholderia anthina]|uniref:hypothetical protein n=1 Tax=Burkholderia anthina TaxID=179879 RepID=UPI0037BF7D78
MSTYPTINGPKSIDEIRALRALGRDVVKTPLHVLALDVSLNAYQSLANDRRVIGLAPTGERIAIADLIASEKPEHATPRADLIVLTADRLGVPADLLTLVVSRVLAIKDAQSAGSLARYNAVMKARALDDVQFVYDDEDGYGAVEVYSRKALIAEMNAERTSRAAKPVVPPAPVARKPEPVGIGARLRSMFR